MSIDLIWNRDDLVEGVNHSAQNTGPQHYAERGFGAKLQLAVQELIQDLLREDEFRLRPRSRSPSILFR